MVHLSRQPAGLRSRGSLAVLVQAPIPELSSDAGIFREARNPDDHPDSVDLRKAEAMTSPRSSRPLPRLLAVIAIAMLCQAVSRAGPVDPGSIFEGRARAAPVPAPPQLHWIQPPDGRGFVVTVELPRPRLDVDRDGGCLRPRLPERGVANWRPAGASPDYGWLVGLPEVEGANLELLDVVEEALRRPADGHGSSDLSLCADLRPGLAEMESSDSETDYGHPETGTGGRSRDRAGASVPSGAIGDADLARLPDSRLPVASLEPAGTLRGQNLARLVLRPLAAEDAGRLRLRRRVTLRLAYSRPETVRLAPPLDGPFEHASRSLLNADWLPRRAGKTQVPPSAPTRSAGEFGEGSDGPQSLDQIRPAAGDPDALKVLVDADGPVALSGQDLADAGWDLAAIDPDALALEAGGRPLPLAVETAEAGRLGAEDRLGFHGRAMTGLFSRENVYWLRRDGAAPMAPAPRELPRVEARTAEAFSRTLRFEQDSEYVFSLRRWQADDRWMWGGRIDAGRTITRSLQLDDLAPEAGPARLRLRLQGYTDDPEVAPDHHVRLQLNGSPIGSRRFDGERWQEFTYTLPAGLLVDGPNQLVLEQVGDTGASVDSIFLDWVELDYRAGYRAVAGRLDFEAPGPGDWRFEVEGFDRPDIQLVDWADPERPVRLAGGRIEVDGAGGYRLVFEDRVEAEGRYRVWQGGAELAPVGIETNHPSSLRDPEQGADYVIITHPDFLDALEPLVERRRAEGMRVMVARIDDIYDEFSAGVFDPRAIRDFLRHARDHWQAPAPTYALLVGEANLDYRGGMGQGPANYVPAMRVDVNIAGGAGATTSDIWYAALDGDADVLPDLLIGRLSVTRPEQVGGYLDKLFDFEARPIEADWRKRLLMVADDDGVAELEGFNEELLQRLPADLEVERFYAAGYPRDADLTGDILDSLQAGALALNFTGHGNVELWSPWPGGGRIMDLPDMAGLSGGPSTPLFTTATCMNGMVDHPLKPTSLAEIWVRNPDGGGVAAWSPSGFTLVAGERTLFGSFYEGLYDGSGRSIGALTAQAMVDAYAESAVLADIVRMFMLLGDPATHVSAVETLPSPTPSSSPEPSPTPGPAGLLLPYLLLDG